MMLRLVLPNQFQQLATEALLPKAPTPAQRLPILTFQALFLRFALFHPLLELAPASGVVLPYPPFAQQPSYAQPTKALVGPLHILPVTAPWIALKRLLRRQQFGPDWIQIHVIPDCIQISTPRAVHD